MKSTEEENQSQLEYKLSSFTEGKLSVYVRTKGTEPSWDPHSQLPRTSPKWLHSTKNCYSAVLSPGRDKIQLMVVIKGELFLFFCFKHSEREKASTEWVALSAYWTFVATNQPLPAVSTAPVRLHTEGVIVTNRPGASSITAAQVHPKISWVPYLKQVFLSSNAMEAYINEIRNKTSFRHLNLAYKSKPHMLFLAQECRLHPFLLRSVGAQQDFNKT